MFLGGGGIREPTEKPKKPKTTESHEKIAKVRYAFFFWGEGKGLAKLLATYCS